MNLWVPVPPHEEQENIAASIGKQTKGIDNTGDQARRQIDLMNEYRTRLIADVVTGQLDVREADKRLSEGSNLALSPWDDIQGLELLSPEDVDAPPSSREGEG